MAHRTYSSNRSVKLALVPSPCRRACRRAICFSLDFIAFCVLSFDEQIAIWVHVLLENRYRPRRSNVKTLDEPIVAGGGGTFRELQGLYRHEDDVNRRKTPGFLQCLFNSLICFRAPSRWSALLRP